MPPRVRDSRGEEVDEGSTAAHRGTVTKRSVEENEGLQKSLRTNKRVVLLELPVGVPASTSGHAQSSTEPRVASFLAAHPRLMKALVADVEPEMKKVTDQSESDAKDTGNTNVPMMMRKLPGGRLQAVPIVDNSIDAPEDLMANPKQFLDRQVEYVPSLPWASFSSSSSVSSFGVGAQRFEGVGAGASVSEARRTQIRGVGMGVGNEIEDMYMTQTASLMYAPGYCTNFVVEVVTRKLKESARARDERREKRRREEEQAANEESVGVTDTARGEGQEGRVNETAPPRTRRRRPLQQVIGYRVESVATRKACLGTPASFAFSVVAPEIGLRTAAFPPAAFFREHRQAISEHVYRYEDDVEESTLTQRRLKIPPTLQAVWPPTRAEPVPNAMNASQTAAWNRSTEGERECVRGLFETCPFWQMDFIVSRAAETGRCPRTTVAKLLAVSCSYIFPHGPFGRIRVRLGYDPSADPRSRYFQRFIVRLTNFSPIKLVASELAAAPECAEVLRRIRAEAESLPIALLDANAMDAEGEAEKTGGAATGPTRVKFTTDRRFMPVWRNARIPLYCTLLQERRQTWFVNIDQFLDDSALLSIVNYRPLLRKCDEFTGWFHTETFDRITNYVRDDYHRWMVEEVAPRIAALKQQSGATSGGALLSAPSGLTTARKAREISASHETRKGAVAAGKRRDEGDDREIDVDDVDDDELGSEFSRHGSSVDSLDGRSDIDVGSVDDADLDDLADGLSDLDRDLEAEISDGGYGDGDGEGTA